MMPVSQLQWNQIGRGGEAENASFLCLTTFFYTVVAIGKPKGRLTSAPIQRENRLAKKR